MSHVANVAAYVQRESGRLVLFDATANEPDTEYGWFEPGGLLGELGGDSLRTVIRFWEKPSKGRARACWRAAVYGTRWCLSRKYRLCSILADESFHTSWRQWDAPLVFWLRSVRPQSNRSMVVRQRQISPEQSSKPSATLSCFNDSSSGLV